MLPTLLIVDDELEVVKALERLLRKDFTVQGFTDPEQALAAFCQSPTHIVISDMRMPKMNGAEFLSSIAKHNARSKRVALSGHADIELAQQAINEGNVAFYLSKPWDNEDLKAKLLQLVGQLKQENRRQAIIQKIALDNKQLIASQAEQDNWHELLPIEQLEKEDCSEAYQEIAKLKRINHELLMLSANLTAMYSNEPVGHSQRIANQARALAQRIGLSQLDGINVYLAGLYHRIGVSSLPSEIAKQYFHKLTMQQQLEYASYVQVSAEILRSTSMLAPCAELASQLYERVDGKGWPNQYEKEEIAIGARILRVVIEFDLCINGQYLGQNVSPNEAAQLIKKDSGSVIDGAILTKFVQMLSQPEAHEDFEQVRLVSGLTTGMVLVHDIVDEHQHKLLAKYTELSETHLELLNNFQKSQSQPILAYVRKVKGS